MKTTLVVVMLLGAAPAVRAQEHADCPMHKASDRRAEVDHRHQDATGLQSDGLEHHFLLGSDGGSIRLEVKGAGQTDARDQVRAHLQSVARSFAKGDFSMNYYDITGYGEGSYPQYVDDEMAQDWW